MLRAVVFDAVGTLIHPIPDVAQVYAEVGQQHGSRHTIEALRGRFRSAFQRQEAIDRADDWRTDEGRELRRWRDIVAEALDDVADPQACFDALYQHFAQPASWKPDVDAATLLAELQRRGLRLAMASNFDCRLHAVHEGLPELRLLDALIVSSEIGVRKPGRAFFEAIAARLELPTSQILYVGDDPANDYQGATAAGMPALLKGPPTEAAKTIARLAEVLERINDFDHP